jgi:hypothetical protein
MLGQKNSLFLGSVYVSFFFFFLFFFFFFFFTVVGTERRVLQLPGKRASTELNLQPLCFLIITNYKKGKVFASC